MVDAAQSPAFLNRTLLFVGCVLVFRLIYAALFPVNPAGDEAYYWDWGRNLDYGYYSKPPLIAWLYAFVDWIGGGSLFAIRATAAVLGTLSLLLLFRLTASLFDSETAWIAVLLGGIAPANSVLSFFLTIDAPLVFCWSTALWMLWRIVSGEGKVGSLILLFLALALGHLTKQMMMAFPVLAIGFFCLHRDTRHFLRKPSIWLVLVGSYLSLIPPLIWNSQNEWITFQHTGHHFQATSDGGNVFVERAEDFLSFLGTQLGVLGPVTGIILFSVCLLNLRLIRRISRPIRFLLIFGAVPLAGMLLLALRQELEPNWPAVFYVSCFALAAAWFTGNLSSPFPPQTWRRHLKAALVVNAALALFFYVGPLVFEATGIAGHKADPNRRMIGYDLLAARLEQLREETVDGHDLFLVTLGHRDMASQLAFGLPDQPKVYLWDAHEGIRSQYELWNDPEEDGFSGKDGLFLLPNSGSLPEILLKAFTKVEKLDEFAIPFGYDRSLKFTVFRGFGLQSWPEDPAPSH